MGVPAELATVPPVPRTGPIRTLSSAMVILLSGSFSMSLDIRSRNSGFSSGGNLGVSVLMASYMSSTLSRSKGIFPYRRQYSDTPMDHRSAALPDTSPCFATHNSGGKKAGEPAGFAVLIASSFSNISETPKSTILSTSSPVRRRLSGLMSRCTTPWECTE